MLSGGRPHGDGGCPVPLVTASHPRGRESRAQHLGVGVGGVAAIDQQLLPRTLGDTCRGDQVASRAQTQDVYAETASFVAAMPPCGREQVKGHGLGLGLGDPQSF